MNTSPSTYGTWYLVIRAELRRILWNAAEHMTHMISAGAITALLFYVFHDFIATQVASISPNTAQVGLTGIAAAVSLLTGVLARSTTYRLIHGKESFLPMMSRVGSTKKELSTLTFSLRFTVIAICGLINFAVLTRWNLTPTNMVPWFLFVAVSLLPKKNVTLRSSAPNAIKSIIISDWRWHQLLYHRMPGRGLIFISFMAALSTVPVAFMTKHYFITQIAALLAGIIASWGLAAAVASDLPCTWFEKQAGMTHDGYIHSWHMIALRLAALLMTIAGLGALASYLLVQSTWIQTASIVALAGLPLIVTPSLVLQIDGRARVTNTILLTLVHTFIGTALMAAPWCVIAVPVLMREAGKYQSGRFYRA